MAAAFSSCFRPSSGRRPRRHHPPPPISGCPNLTTSVYHTNFAIFSLSWSQSPLSRTRSLLLHFHQNPKPFDSPHSSESSSISFRLLLRPLILWKNRGSEKLSAAVHVFWDLRRANFSSSSPEPRSGFFIAVVVHGEIALLLGDMIKDAYAKTRATTNQIFPQSLVLKREHVIAHKIYRTRARFGGRIREIEIDCGLFCDESRLSFGVDGKRILEVKRLKWKFRGNERLEVAGVPVHIYWDVYNWIFESGKEKSNAVFMFRFEEEGEEQSDSVVRQQNWNLGLNELEWRKMRSSLSSSSASASVSMSSAGSSAGASSSIMEWANTDESESTAAPMGFSLLIYAWRR